MKIVVNGEVIETKEITDIYEVEKYKKMFVNREAGFVIKLMDGSEKRFSERIPYETTDRQIGVIKNKWEKLQDEVYEKWQEDKHNLEEFNIDD